MAPNKQVYEAANKLKAPEMKAFVEWLEAERQETLESGSTVGLDKVQLVQGKAQMLARILEVIETSSDVLSK